MSERVAYDFAVLRLVPHPHLERWIPVGVVVHARTEEYLGARVISDPETLGRLSPEVDADVLSRYLQNWHGIAEGRDDAGPIALYPPSERFHWLTCPARPHRGPCGGAGTTLDRADRRRRGLVAVL